MSDKNIILMLVYAKWCGHCVRYLETDESGTNKWTKVCKELEKCSELHNDNINLDMIKLEEGQLKELANLEKEIDSTNKNVSVIKKILEELKRDAVINYDIDYKALRDKVEFFPTLIALTKEQNGVFQPVKKIFNGKKEVAEDLKQYILHCRDCDKSQEGGKYKKKYKKYKELYRDLLNKQKGGFTNNDYKNKYLKYKKLYLNAINK
jgi:thiol-disulfide isomerase/thioredoxin